MLYKHAHRHIVNMYTLVHRKYVFAERDFCLLAGGFSVCVVLYTHAHRYFVNIYTMVHRKYVCVKRHLRLLAGECEQIWWCSDQRK